MVSKLQVIIPHSNFKNYDYISINNTPYHRWEHLFIRILKTYYHYLNIEVLGFTTKKNTIITITSYGKEKLSLNIEETRFLLKNYKVKSKWMKNEIYIINNELNCMSSLYGIDYGKCEDKRYLSFKEMNSFRKSGYLWESIELVDSNKKIITPVVKKNDTKLVSHVDLISRKRQKLLRLFLQNTDYKNLVCTNKEKFFLVSFPVYLFSENITISKVEKAINYLDKEDGFYITQFKTRYPFSIVTWPSIDELDNNIWVNIYIYMKSEYLNYFIRKNIERIYYELNDVHVIEKNTYKKIINNIRILYE